VQQGKCCADPHLTSRVPNLQFDHFAIQLYCSYFEINTNGGNVAVRVRIVSEPQQQARFAYTRVTN
jgi:hypothetical protein